MASVLVVEDDRDVARTFALALQLEGHQVRAVYDGSTALFESVSQAPDIAVVDVGLRSGGIEFAHGLRHIHGNAVRVIGCSGGYANISLPWEKARTAFDYVFAKPVRVDTLADAVRKLDESRRCVREPQLVPEPPHADIVENARRQLAEGERHLNDQRARIDWLVARRYDAREAHKLLAIMAQAQLAMRGHLAVVEREAGKRTIVSPSRWPRRRS